MQSLLNRLRNVSRSTSSSMHETASRRPSQQSFRYRLGQSIRTKAAGLSCSAGPSRGSWVKSWGPFHSCAFRMEKPRLHVLGRLLLGEIAAWMMLDVVMRLVFLQMLRLFDEVWRSCASLLKRSLYIALMRCVGL